jgi:uncharacterized membrane protein
MVVGVQSGFLYTGGQFQRIACPNNSNTLAQGINDDGVIVGWCSNPFPGPEQGFIYQNGSYSSVTYPGSTLTVLNGINRQGDLIGVYQLGQQSGFAYTAGSFKSLKGTRSGNGINSSTNNRCNGLRRALSWCCQAQDHEGLGYRPKGFVSWCTRQYAEWDQ